MMASFPARERAAQRASGLWGDNKTYGQFQAELNRLSPEQHAEYVRQTIAGRGAVDALEGAKHMHKPGEGPQAFAGNLKPGSMDHIKAIWDLGTLAGHNVSDGRPSSDTMGNALHNMARSIAGRDMKAAAAHLESAKWGNEHEAGMAYSSELEDIAAQLPRVPKQELGWMPQRNPLMAEHQHPGRFRPSPGPPVAPTYGAMQIPHYEIDSGGHSQYSNVLHAIELSAQTARLAVTPAPRGRPGGPGLYDVKGMGHSAYLQQIVKSLIEKRGMPPGKAYAIARGSIRRWARGGGKVHPEVRAAAGKAEAEELEKQARARMTHGHANDWAQVILLVGTAAGAAQDSRTPTGQFGSGSGTASKQAPAKGKQPAKAPAKAAPAKQKPQSQAQIKSGLLSQAANLSAQAAKARAQAKLLAQALKGTTSSQAGSTTSSAGSTTASTASTTASSAASTATSTASSAASTTSSSGATLTSQQIAALQAKYTQTQLAAQINTLNAQASQDDAQAAKLRAQAAKL